MALTKVSKSLVKDNTFLELSGGAMTGTLDLNSQALKNLIIPVDANDAVTKQYADSIASGLDTKNSSHMATVADLGFNYVSGGGTNNGVGDTLTDPGNNVTIIDAVVVDTLGERILVKDQDTPMENGIYVITTIGVAGSVATVLTRADDFDGNPSNEVSGGAYTFIENGTVNANSGWMVTGSPTGPNDAIIVGTDPIIFTRVSGAGQLVAGQGLVQTGTTWDIISAVGSANIGTLITTNGDIGVDLGTGVGVAASGDHLHDSRYLQLVAGGTMSGTISNFASDGIDDNASATAMTIDSSGNVGIGTSNPGRNLTITDSSSNTFQLTTPSFTGTGGLQPVGAAGTGFEIQLNTVNGNTFIASREDGASLIFNTEGIDRMRIDSSGNVGIGTTNPSRQLHLARPLANAGGEICLSSTTTATNGDFGRIHFGNSTDTSLAGIFAETDGASDSGMIRFLTEPTGSSIQERMRIDSNGYVLIGKTTVSSSVIGSQFSSDGNLTLVRNNGRLLTLNRLVMATNTDWIDFRKTGVSRGTLRDDGAGLVLFKNSDYRLKENDVEISNGISLLKQLRPIRFNMIDNPDLIVDGFFAHEVQEVVPGAATGIKDETDDEFVPIMQQMDQGKLIPLLTAALKEAIDRIETLEEKLTDAGIF